ncbi:sigma factor-like helix-turn-helix DNA-binding protein [Streptomyces fradiae]|uniref:sigma factor-like helix-turn-helix DNA-binding protein n=1 Tax=Streptomyces fradiae TaxID=1906 RepID=UPI00201A0841|nr:sigma factor-like helix-turn-helix DNA-binding protein [Streptomyces fradiae]UQS29613.1 DNA-directed RNA polymerase sigma-70 factor [Streptomyces fradiae]
MSQRTTAQSPPSRSRPSGAVPPTPAAEPGPDTPADERSAQAPAPADPRPSTEPAAAGPAEEPASAEPGADASAPPGGPASVAPAPVDAPGGPASVAPAEPASVAPAPAEPAADASGAPEPGTGPTTATRPPEDTAPRSADAGPAGADPVDAETTAEVPLPTGSAAPGSGGEAPTSTGPDAAEPGGDAAPSAGATAAGPGGGAAPVPAVGRGRVEFDALYERAAPALIHQVYLLTGRRGDAFDSVEHAFQRAWEHWPEVFHDPDPVGWVRSRAFEHALAPWRWFRRPRRPGGPPADPVHRALLELPPLYRRTVLLCDGVGLTVDEAAAEAAATVPATTSRLEHARAALLERLPEPVGPEEARERLSALAGAVSTATLPLARSVRTGSERRLRALTGTVFGLTALLAGAVVFSAVTPRSPSPEPAPAPYGSVSDDGAPGRGTSAPPGGGPSAPPSP